MKYIKLGIAVMLTSFTFISCEETNKTGNVTGDKDTMVLKEGENVSSQKKENTNWNEVSFTSPIVRYDEITAKDLEVREDDKFVTYGMEENILFASGSAEVKPESKENLNQIMTSMNKRTPDSEIRIYGFTDSVDTKEFNKKLSRDRAESVKNYLVQNGNIAENRISIEAEGESNPVASNETAKGRQQNRRVIIVAEKN